MLPVMLGLAGALLAKGMTKDDVMKEVERRADLLDKAYYTTEDVAKISGLSEYTVRKKIRDGELPAEGEGNRSGYQIRKDALMEFLVNQRSCIRNRERAANTWTEEEIGAYTARRAAASAVAKAVTGSSSLGAAVTGAALASGVPGLRSSVSSAAAGVALVGALAGSAVALVPLVSLSAAALFGGKKEVSEGEIDAMAQMLANARLLRQYIDMKEKSLAQLRLEKEEIQLSYADRLDSDAYRRAVIPSEKRINEAEIELDILRSQLSELEKHAKETS